MKKIWNLICGFFVVVFLIFACVDVTHKALFAVPKGTGFFAGVLLEYVKEGGDLIRAIPSNMETPLPASDLEEQNFKKKEKQYPVEDGDNNLKEEKTEELRETIPA